MRVDDNGLTNSRKTGVAAGPFKKNLRIRFKASSGKQSGDEQVIVSIGYVNRLGIYNAFAQNFNLIQLAHATSSWPNMLLFGGFIG